MEKITKKGNNWTIEETFLFVEIMIDEEFNFAGCRKRQALKRSANEEVYKEVLQLFEEKDFGKEKCEPLQVDIKQLQAKCMLSNKSGAKSKTDHEKTAAWLQRVILSGTKN